MKKYKGNIWRNIKGIWRHVKGIWKNIKGIWRYVKGIWRYVKGIWRNIKGIWRHARQHERNVSAKRIRDSINSWYHIIYCMIEYLIHFWSEWRRGILVSLTTQTLDPSLPLCFLWPCCRRMPRQQHIGCPLTMADLPAPTATGHEIQEHPVCIRVERSWENLN